MSETIHSDAVLALNGYIWQLMVANEGWTTDNYGGRRPIVPANQQPEYLEYKAPFIVYGSAVNRIEGMPFQTSETIAYTIYATTAGEANRVMRVITEALRWMDESAKNVNNWLVYEGQTRTGGKRPTTFQSISVLSATSAGPELQEGGRVDSQVIVNAQYMDHGEMKVTVTDFGL